MKFTGGKKGGTHLGTHASQGAGRDKRAGKTGRRLKRILLSLLIVVAVVATVLVVYAKTAIKPPEQKGSIRSPSAQSSDIGGYQPSPEPGDAEASAAPPTGSAEPGPSHDGSLTGRNADKYSFVLLGSDDGGANTDTFMVATFDSAKYTLDVVNIPRDTLVNVSWPTKKINSILANVGMDGLVTKLADITGFEVDFYVMVDLDAFKKLIDAIDGVDFYIPRDMNYDDPTQNLSIHFKKGQTHLNGDEALELVRFRQGGGGYATGDIGRIEMQQQFLSEAIKQVLGKKDKIDLATLADVFLNNVETDLTLGNCLWFAQQFLKMDTESVSFNTMPFKNLEYKGSYVTIVVDEWLELLNTRISPFYNPFKAEDLGIFTRNSSGKFYVTDGHYAGNNQSWGGSGGSSSGGGATKPVSTASPKPSSSSSPSSTPGVPPSAGPNETPSLAPSETPGASALPPSETPGGDPVEITILPPSSTPSVPPSETPGASQPPAGESPPSGQTEPTDTPAITPAMPPPEVDA